jgi:RNA polymerase sigma factor (sigma-70 family)
MSGDPADNGTVSDIANELDGAIERARAGDPRGFELLYRTLGDSVAGYLRARSVSDPEGIADDVFLRAFRTIHTFQGDTRRFRAWIFTIAHHAAVDDVRHRRRRVQEAPLSRAPDAAGGDVEDEVIANLAHERVRALVSGLSAEQRDVLMLRVVADLSISETAAVLGKSYEAVKALQRRGLNALRRTVSSQERAPR